MSTFWTPALVAAGAALTRVLWVRFTAWRQWRNALEDDERASLFWNDRKYNLLSLGIHYSPLIVIVLFGLWMGIELM